MTPAKLLALKEARIDYLEALALPTDKLAFLYACAHNTGKYDDDGKLVSKPEPLDFENFRTCYRRSKKHLAAKLPKMDHALYGAYANHDAFKSWAGHKVGAVFVPTKED